MKRILSPERRERGMLYLLLLIALIERVFMALSREGFNHPHEIYRVLEPTRELLFGTSVRVFEYDLEMLFWIPVLLHAAAIKIFIWAGLENPVYQTGALRILYACISMLSVYGVYWLLKKYTGRRFALLGPLLMILWVPFAYFQIHLFESIVVGNLLFIPLILYLSEKKPHDSLRAFLSGTVLAVMFFIRIQAGLFAVMFLLFALYEKRYRAILPALAGFLIVLFSLGYLDTFFGAPFLRPPFNNFNFNVIQDGAAKHFGAQSHFYYFVEAFKFYSPLLFLAIAFLIFRAGREAKLMAFLSLGSLAFHTMLSHKEFRFIFPVLPLFLILGVIGLYHVRGRFVLLWRGNKYFRIVVVSFAIFTTGYQAYRGLVRYSYTSWGENCRRLYDIGRWYADSRYKHIDRLHIQGDNTFMCGSFHLGSAGGEKGPLRVTYQNLGNERELKGDHLLLKSGREETGPEAFISEFSGWYLFLRKAKGEL